MRQVYIIIASASGIHQERISAPNSNSAYEEDVNFLARIYGFFSLVFGLIK